MTRPALVAVDLGAESCRVSLLRWPANGARPGISMVRRFANGPWNQGTAGFHWNLDRICDELQAGLLTAAEQAEEGIASIGVTGWAVDYVRLDDSGKPIAAPFCYRDPRNAAALARVHEILPAERLYARTGVQIQPINTIYQLYADKLAGVPESAPWVNLPEYILHWLGAPRIAEYTNASHTALVDPDTRTWSDEIFSTLGLDRSAAPDLVAPGSALGPLRADLRRLRAFSETQLIAPACHDTASAIAGIPAGENRTDWAYISSGTWSLVGMVLSETQRTPEACAGSFTNLGAAGGGVLFHRGLPGMWLLRQCLDAWPNSNSGPHEWSIPDLIAEARALPGPDALLDLNDPAFLSPGDMPGRINAQRHARGLAPLPESCDAAALYANLLFHSLARSYGEVLAQIAAITGRHPQRICVVGGGSRNEYLNQLTAEAAGIPVERCSVESSTLGNFAVQLARLGQSADGVSATSIASQAHALQQAEILV